MQEDQLTLFAGDSPAKTLASQENDVDLLATALASGTSLHESLMRLNQRGWSSKTCQAYSLLPTEKILPPSFSGWRSAGMAWGGESLTLKASDLPSDASVCLLSEVLEHHVDARYYLSPKACNGILNRAKKRGKTVPEALRQALEAMASAQEDTIAE
jgi:hypothetical protein